MRVLLIYSALGVALLACKKAPILSLKQTNKDKRVAIQPIGTFDSSQTKHLRSYVSGFFSVQTVMLEPIDIPQKAIINKNGGLSADFLLSRMIKTKPDSIDIVIGITHADIFMQNDSASKQYKKGATAHDWKGVLGLSYVKAHAAIISDARLKTLFRSDFFNLRLYPVVLHEMGHILGLEHCSEKRCAMSEANGAIWAFDDELRDYCKKCRQKLN
jgi:archaemetzincin